MNEITAEASQAWTADLPPDSPEHIDHGRHVAGYIDESSRYDGSRTPPQKIALVHVLKREGRSVNAICQILSMNPHTVKAIIARGDDLITDARMLLKANALGFAGDAIQASQEAAKRGKLEGISAMLDRLGITEPPKAQNQVNLGVQVVLHGGEIPSELGVSPAKVAETSETAREQAVISDGLIMDVPNTCEIAQQPVDTQAVVAAAPVAKVTPRKARAPRKGAMATVATAKRKQA